MPSVICFHGRGMAVSTGRWTPPRGKRVPCTGDGIDPNNSNSSSSTYRIHPGTLCCRYGGGITSFVLSVSVLAVLFAVRDGVVSAACALEWL